MNLSWVVPAFLSGISISFSYSNFSISSYFYFVWFQLCFNCRNFIFNSFSLTITTLAQKKTPRTLKLGGNKRTQKRLCFFFFFFIYRISWTGNFVFYAHLCAMFVRSRLFVVFHRALISWTCAGCCVSTLCQSLSRVGGGELACVVSILAWAPRLQHNPPTHTHTSRPLDQASARARVTEDTLIFPLWVHLPAEKGSRCCNPTPASAPLGILVFPVPSIFSMKFLCLPPSQRTQAEGEGWRSRSGEKYRNAVETFAKCQWMLDVENNKQNLFKKRDFSVLQTNWLFTLVA